jgi:hypothetical protein
MEEHRRANENPQTIICPGDVPSPGARAYKRGTESVEGRKQKSRTDEVGAVQKNKFGILCESRTRL